jgi:hypothetical protein
VNDIKYHKGSLGAELAPLDDEGYDGLAMRFSAGNFSRIVFSGVISPGYGNQ